MQDTPWPGVEGVFINESSGVTEERRFIRFDVVNEKELKGGGRLPPIWSTQTAELCALVRVCKLYRDKIVNVFTDSKYAYG